MPEPAVGTCGRLMWLASGHSRPTSSPHCADAQCAGEYAQCGGIGWTGLTCCPAGWVCTPQTNNPYYSQCLPGPNPVPGDSCAPMWQKCGGLNSVVKTCCNATAICKFSNPYHSQCEPGP